jgi:hypothetical protein
MALHAVENGLAEPPSSHPNVSGVMIDIPARAGFVTLVALTDDTTSLYTSVGGGTIGAGAHASVAEATHSLLSAVEATLGKFTDEDDGELPPPGKVRIHVLSPSGGRRADVSDDSFWGREASELKPVIATAQTLMTSVRQASPS